MCDHASIISYYAKRASEYERIYEKPERQEDLHKLRTIVERFFSGADVLELACGTGYWTQAVARSASSVLATDVNEEVLAIARAKPLGLRKVTFQRADAYTLPAWQQVFTGGFSAFWWSHIPQSDIRGFLLGFKRVLSRGAKVMFIDNVYVQGSSTPISRTDTCGNTYQLRKLTDGTEHEVLKNFPSDQDLLAAVEGIASDVQVQFLRYYWILTFIV